MRLRRATTSPSRSSTDDPAGGDRVLVGRVVKAHGIRGEVAVHLLSDVPDRFAPGTEMDVDDDRLVIAASRPHQGRQLVHFRGVDDRTAAERLRGAELRAAPLDSAPPDEYFASELVGMVVTGMDGAILGTVVHLIELPDAAGYDLLEVDRGDGTTWLLPAVDEFVEIVESEDGDEHLELLVPADELTGL